mmetsp:Transcript_11746/g.23912  ORF Transcript_11746/g.23912 Transcript_11746/m.23912 type:complete len:301 (-) Transcript_11746:42-944(-)
MTEHTQNIEEELHRTTKNVEELQMKLLDTRDEASRLRQELTSKTECLAKVQTEFAVISEEQASFKRRCNQRETELNDLLQHEKKQYSESEILVRNLTSKIGILEASLDDLSKSLRDKSEQETDRAATMSTTITEHERTIISLRSKLVDAESHFEASRSRLERELGTRKDEFESHERKYREQIRNLSEKTEQFDKLEQKLQAAEAKATAMEEELSTEKRRTQAMLQKISQLETDNVELGNQMQTIRKDFNVSRVAEKAVLEGVHGKARQRPTKRVVKPGATARGSARAAKEDDDWFEDDAF